MKLKNKKTGEIKELPDGFFCGDSLKKICEEWEDYEEDELLYVISAEHKSGYQCVLKEEYPEICEVAKELGIGFETEKECREFCNKLLAWQRLKEKGFKFDRWQLDNRSGIWVRGKLVPGIVDELDILLGGEEDLIDAMIKIDKLQEMEIAKMEAKIEAYELALTGKLPAKEPKGENEIDN